MKLTISPVLVLALILTACGMFEDKFHNENPTRINFDYPGILDITLFCIFSEDDRSPVPNVSNSVIIRNTSNKTLSGIEILVNVFSNTEYNYENLIRYESVLFPDSLRPGSSDTLALTSTHDFLRFQKTTQISLSDVNGVPANMLSGVYTGSFTLFKSGSATSFGNVLADIDIRGKFAARLQKTNPVNVIDGTLSHDSTLYCDLKDNGSLIHRTTTHLKSAAEKFRITYHAEIESMDSIVMELSLTK